MPTKKYIFNYDKIIGGPTMKITCLKELASNSEVVVDFRQSNTQLDSTTIKVVVAPTRKILSVR